MTRDLTKHLYIGILDNKLSTNEYIIFCYPIARVRLLKILVNFNTANSHFCDIVPRLRIKCRNDSWFNFIDFKRIKK